MFANTTRVLLPDTTVFANSTRVVLANTVTFEEVHV